MKIKQIFSTMLKRLPSLPDIMSVYAVIATMLFTWSTLVFLWYLPSWMHFMTLGDLLPVFCYVMTASFVESLTFLLVLLLLCVLLPSNFLRNEFIPRGTTISLVVIGLIMLRNRFPGSGMIDFFFSINGLVLILAVILAAFLSTRIALVRRALISFSDRLTIFLYILIPLCLFSLVVILIRNIL